MRILLNFFNLFGRFFFSTKYTDFPLLRIRLDLGIFGQLDRNPEFSYPDPYQVQSCQIINLYLEPESGYDRREGDCQAYRHAAQGERKQEQNRHHHPRYTYSTNGSGPGSFNLDLKKSYPFYE